MSYPIQPANVWTTIFMLVLGALMLCAPVILWLYKPPELAGLVVAAAVCVPVAALFLWLAYGQGHSAIELNQAGIELHTPFYGRTIHYDQIDVDGIEIVDLHSNTPLRPRWRTNGVGLPGLRLGWFRTRDKRKSLLAVTDSKVIAIPTREGFVLIASVANPHGLAEAIQRRALERGARHG